MVMEYERLASCFNLLVGVVLASEPFWTRSLSGLGYVFFLVA